MTLRTHSFEHEGERRNIWLDDAGASCRSSTRIAVLGRVSLDERLAKNSFRAASKSESFLRLSEMAHGRMRRRRDNAVAATDLLIILVV